MCQGFRSSGLLTVEVNGLYHEKASSKVFQVTQFGIDFISLNSIVVCVFEGTNMQSNGKKGESAFCPVGENEALPADMPTLSSLSAFGKIKTTNVAKLTLTPEIRFSEGKHKNKLKPKGKILKKTLKRLLAKR